MFVVTEADAAAIRAAFDRGGELSAAVELRRLFPGVTWILWAWLCAGPGPTGECRPLSDQTTEGRGTCLHAAREMRQANSQIIAHCRRLKPDDGVTLPSTRP